MNKKQITRKDFINSLFRTTILAGMAALVGLFFYKDQISGSRSCPTNPTCKSCSKLSNCNLEEAKTFRNNGKR